MALPVTSPSLIIDPSEAVAPTGVPPTQLMSNSLRDQLDYEPLLDKTLNRFIIYPIRDHKLWTLYKRARASFWVPGEIDLSRDLVDWKSKLNPTERNLLSYVLAFFAASDGIVNENLAARFMQEVTLPEARCFYGFQIMIENIHAETYADMIAALIELPGDRERMFNAIFSIECVSEKAAWALKWSENTTAPFAMRLAAFAAVEGIFFSSSFAIIFWLKSRGLMPGLSYANELISRDEGLHQEFACELFQRIRFKPDNNMVTEMITEAVMIEKKFVRDALPDNLPGMNQRLMSEYIEFIADRLMSMLGFPAIFNSTNPFGFMELISLEGKANFFERQVSAYQIAFSGVE